MSVLAFEIFFLVLLGVASLAMAWFAASLFTASSKARSKRQRYLAVFVSRGSCCAD
ncbi:hypothetical protein ACOM2C_08505 [Pseudarthrobacter sp. So.54]